ncbi:unnamed protein product [Pylaiella littoralis]
MKRGVCVFALASQRPVQRYVCVCAFVFVCACIVVCINRVVLCVILSPFLELVIPAGFPRLNYLPTGRLASLVSFCVHHRSARNTRAPTRVCACLVCVDCLLTLLLSSARSSSARS